MKTYTVTIDDAAKLRFDVISEHMGRSIESLIEIAAEEAALDYFRRQGGDPARPST